MSEIPHYLEYQVPENGTMSDELLLALVKTIEKQNSIVDDTIHSELQRIADSQARIAQHLLGIESALNQIVRHYVVGV